MKIIHCADLHLNSKMETHFDLAKSVSRKKEILNTFFGGVYEKLKVYVINFCYVFYVFK